MARSKGPQPGRPYRILYVNHASKIAGAEQCLLRMIKNLDRTRYKAFLACPEGDLAQEARRQDVPVFPLRFTDYQRNRSRVGKLSCPNPFLAQWHAVQAAVLGRRIAALARRESVHLIHANSLLARVPTYLGGRIAGVPVVWHVRDILSSRLWLFVYDFLAVHGVARLITVSNACQVQFSCLSNVATVYDGIDCEAFKWDADARSRVRAELGWDEGHTIFGIFGRISSTKGHDHFVEAAVAVHAKHPQTRWLVVGEAWSQEEQHFLSRLRRRASEAGLDRSIIFTGFRTDVSALMSACDVVVIPSIIQDSFPNTVLEGMACSRAIVAYAVGGIPEAIEDGISGLLVRPMDPKGLAEAETLLIENPALREKLGRNARDRVVTHFGVEQAQEGIERIYDEILTTAAG
ncbi:MAG: glycosyltransferase family 4 protein [Desulfomonilaceae bacterium]